MKRATWTSLVLVTLAVAVGMVRDFLFVNLNYELHFREHRKALNYAHSQFKALVHGWSTADLHTIKWGLAILFVLFNLALAIALARVRFGNHHYRLAIILGFLIICGLALTAHVLAPYLAGFDTLSTKLLHAVQYPVLLLVLWAASWLPRTQ